MKKKLIHSILIAVLALVVILVGVPDALADDTICNDMIVGGTVDNVIAKDGCEMVGTKVTGNVWVDEDAWDVWFINITVDGNFQTDGARRVILTRSTIYGDVQMKNLRFNSGVYETYIGGDLQVEGNKWLSLYKNRIEGNLQAFKNTGGMYIAEHIISENLQCYENDPSPYYWGDPNIVGGTKDGQCSDF